VIGKNRRVRIGLDESSNLRTVFRQRLTRQRLTHFLKILEIFKISKFFGKLCQKYYKWRFLQEKFRKIQLEIGTPKIDTPKIDAFSSFEHYQNVSIFGEGL